MWLERLDFVGDSSYSEYFPLWNNSMRANLTDSVNKILTCEHDFPAFQLALPKNQLVVSQPENKFDLVLSKVLMPLLGPIRSYINQANIQMRITYGFVQFYRKRQQINSVYLLLCSIRLQWCSRLLYTNWSLLSPTPVSTYSPSVIPFSRLLNILMTAVSGVRTTILS